MNTGLSKAISWAELGGLLPDAVIRRGVRRVVRKRLGAIGAEDCAQAGELTRRFIAEMRSAAVAPLPDRANEQHYEVPATFFEQVLGAHRKYSCAYWPAGTSGLDDAEAAALSATCEHARLGDGARILELGCGWGSLTLWMAQRYPMARITAVSNSHSQREFIETCARERDLGNVTVLTRDMNDFDAGERFDRVVSVEMFEHMRNYPVLFERISRWLNEDGLFFMHVFCHRSTPYAFVDEGPGDWMSRHFFSGGMMPSDALPLHFQQHLVAVDQWRWDGRHYERTANAWLAKMDDAKEAIMPMLEHTYGTRSAGLWWTRWRIFFIACSELFGYADGQEWWVAHYLMRRAGSAAGHS